MTGLSDEALVEEILENPYMQALCGFRSFFTEDVLDSSTLSKMRERLGLSFFKELERKTYKVLIDRKIIKAKGMIVDATVFPEEIKYPNDVGLLNDVREWLVAQIKRVGKVLGIKYKRRLLGQLCRAAVETLLKYFQATTGTELWPGVVVVIQSFGQKLNFHPHLHLLVSEGGKDEDGRFH